MLFRGEKMMLNIRNRVGCSKSSLKSLFKSYPIICPRCNKKFMKKRKRHKFCSEKCKNQFNAGVRYEKLKDNPSFKLKAKKCFEKWRINNLEKHNAYMRKYMKERLLNDVEYREKQDEWKRNHKKEIAEQQRARYYQKKIENEKIS